MRRDVIDDGLWEMIVDMSRQGVSTAVSYTSRSPVSHTVAGGPSGVRT